MDNLFYYLSYCKFWKKISKINVLSSKIDMDKLIKKLNIKIYLKKADYKCLDQQSLIVYNKKIIIGNKNLELYLGKNLIYIVVTLFYNSNDIEYDRKTMEHVKK